MHSTPPVTPSMPDSPPYGLLQIALDQSASGLIVYEKKPDEPKRGNQSLRVALMNKRAEEITGLLRQEAVGQTVDKLFSDSQTAAIWPAIENVIESGKAHQQDFFWSNSRTKLAAWYDLRIEPIGDGERAVVSYTDISELRHAQETRLSDSILFNALSSTVPEVGVLVTDFFKKVLIASGTLPGLLATTDPDELVGSLLENKVLPEFRDDWRNYLGTALAGESHFFSDHWGGWRSEVYVGPVRNQYGNVVMILIVFRNVTEQYRQQQALIQSNSALQQSNQSLEQFAYVASHDLQEPLRKIRAFGDLIRANYGSAIGAEGAGMIERM